MGEFEDWDDVNKPPLLIQNFIDLLSELLRTYTLKKFKVILTDFAEEETTTKHLLKVNTSELKNALFCMSAHCYDIWADNLIIEIID